MQAHNELAHEGIPGMHWGVRRYQNADGTLTAAGKARYGKKVSGLAKKNQALERKAADAREKAEQYDTKSEKYQRKYVRKAGFPLTDFGVAAAERAHYKANRMSVKSSDFLKKAEKAEKTIQQNQRLITAMNSKINELDSSTVQLGEEYLKKQSR